MKKSKLIYKFNQQSSKLKEFENEIFKKSSISNPFSEKSEVSYTDKNTLNSIMNTFRPLYINASSISFLKIINTLLKIEEYQKYHNKLNNAKAYWEEYMAVKKYKQITKKIEKEISNKELFEIYSNQEYWHQEHYIEGSNRGLDRIKRGASPNLVEFSLFIPILQKLCVLILSLNREVIEKIIIEHEHQINY